MAESSNSVRVVFEACQLTLKDTLQECLGGPWPDPCPLEPEWGQWIQRDGFRMVRVTYQVEPGERVPAFLLVPTGVDEQHPAPGILVWHQHNGEWHLGKSEPAGLAGNPMHHTGVALVREGYVVLCPDALCFEERQNPHLKGGDYERFMFLKYVVEGKCLAWKNILDMRRAVDFMASLPFVDSSRLGCYGHSMGSTFTWLVGPWEERLRCLVGNCCLPTYAAIHRYHLLHSFSNFIPGWGAQADTPWIVGLIAPRPLHLNFGELDEGSPIDEVREGLKIIEWFYERSGAPENFSVYIQPGVGHVVSPEMWERTRNWFARHLRGM